MGDELGGFLDKDQLLGGSPARRAATLLFLIEARTAKLAAQAKQRLVRPLTEESVEEQALDFVEAFSAARETAVQPSVYELERQADGWAPLVPHNPRLQAALAQRLGDKYRFTPQVAPGIRKALGLDDPAVGDAYQALYDAPVASVFAPRLTPRERARWAWTSTARRLETMPPFWTAYSLSLTETVGTDILALPIALATLGVLPALVLLVALGLVNVLTVAYMAESVVRTGPMRYRNAFLGRLFESNLGSRGSIPVTALLVVSEFFWIPVCYVGIGRTLGSVTSVPAALWIAVLYGVTLLYLRRGSLDATVATALVVGAVNLVLILGLSGLAFTHVDGGNLAHTQVPFLNGSFQASHVALIFGVVLMGYFGHLSAATCGSLVLERDPGGRSLIRACVAAQLTAIGLYCLFVAAAIGAVGSHALTGVAGTAVSPLADVVGPSVAVLGSAFVIVSLGLGSILSGLSLSWLVQERLPTSRPRIVVLPRRRAWLVFRPRGRSGLRAALTYLGSAAEGARFSIDLEDGGRLEQSEVVVSKRSELLPAGESSRHRLVLEVLDADDRRARVAVTSTLRMSYEGELDAAGLDLVEVLNLSDAEAALAGSLARSGEASAAAVARDIGKDEYETLAMLEALAARGVVEARRTPDGPLFTTRMAPRRGRRSSVWQALADDQWSPGAVSTATSGQREPLGGLLRSRSGRFLVSVLPLTAAFALSEWFLVSDVGSFTELLSILGVVVVSLLAGLYPVLMLVASRRKGEYAPAVVHRFFAWPVILGAVYVLFLGVLVVHGAVIWTDPARRAGAFAAALAMVVIPAMLMRSGAFARRVTIELRDDQRSGKAQFALLSGEHPVSGAVTLEYGDGERRPEGTAGDIPALDTLRRAVFELRRDRAPRPDRVKVWVHRVTPQAETESLPATARVRADGHAEAADLTLSRGERSFPFAHADLEVEIALEERSGS